ncbi:hypothetical protein P43SY_005089 [Pythium insidiosum]|uniref:START domain-containing protein n=1 Tax=Pythium insidiosum TaxID=114742 RepID=A0AAD5LJW4_PYTIN|nr:hypothetical protein P43SY_005089 [Pythium insidiosum]
MKAPSGNSNAAATPPDMLLLDGERLHMLVDVICIDYLTASYASRENAKKVVAKALHKLTLSVLPPGAALPPSLNVRDAAFADRVKSFDDELQLDMERRREQLRAEYAAAASTVAANATRSHALSPSLPVADDTVVRDSLKPKLLVFVDELYRERERQLRATATAGANGSSNSSSSSSVSSSNGNPPRTPSHSTSNLFSTHGAQPPPPPLPPLSSAGTPLWQAGEIRMEGWLRKKGQHVNLWRDRYFMIRSMPNGSHFLCYFRRKGDKEPRGWFMLGPGTTVDEVRESPSKIETKPLFTFRLRHVTHAVGDDEGADVEGSAVHTPSRSATAGDVPMSPDPSASWHEPPDDPRSSGVKKSSSRKFRTRAAAAAAAATAATAVVLTGGLAGVGMIGMGVGMSAAAAASAGAAGALMVQSRNRGPIALAAESLETATWWRNSIAECIAQSEEQWRRYLNWYMDKDQELPEDGASSTSTDGAATTASASNNGSASGVGSPSLLSTTTAAAATRVGPRVRLSSTSSVTPKPALQSVGSGRARSGSFGTVPRSIAKTFRTSATFSQETSWRLYEYSSKLRVDVERSQLQSSWGHKGSAPPALRTSVKVFASPKQVFELLMRPESSFYRLNHVIESARVLETNTQDHSDVVHWRLKRTALWPVTVEARDLCLLRYWRKEHDESYFICFQSTSHSECPVTGDAVRANVLGGGFIISPRVHADENFEECWVTLTIQMHPHGWLDSSWARSWYYVHAYGVYFLEMVTALTVAASDVDTTPRPFLAAMDPAAAALSNAAPNAAGPPASQLIVSEQQFPMLEPFRSDLSLRHVLPPKHWSEPDARSFLVRGPHYLSTQTKVRSPRQAFRLLGVELLRSTQERIRHVGLSSIEAPSYAELPATVLVINFMLPGPPHQSVVLYFTPEDPQELKKNTVFADLCQELLRGSSDDFRTSRIKLLPRVVQGTWSIREGIGSTPAILGTKVHHQYYQGKQYLEVDYDIGSSPVASGIVKMLLGLVRDLVIDLAFVIEAQSSLELPERVLGCVRLDSIDLRHAVAFTPAKKVATAVAAHKHRALGD